jgi:hypothetical protein
LEETSYGAEAGDVIRQRINNVTARERFTHNIVRDITDEIKDATRREEITNAIDKGDFTNLTEKEIKAANQLKEQFAKLGKEAQDLGILKELRENYITHIVDWEKAPSKDIGTYLRSLIEEAGPRMGGVSPKSKFAKERKYETFEDLQKAIEGSGLELKTKDAAEIYQEYARSMTRAIENRKMIDSLKNLKDVEGTPLMKRITEKEPVPRGWQTINSPQMQGYAVHPELAPAMKFVFDNSDPSIIMKGLNTISQASKRMNVMGSLFHAKSLVEAKILTGFKDFAKDIVTGFKGTRDALEMYRKGGLGDQVDTLLKNGLVIETPGDVTRGILGDIGAGADKIIAKFGGPEIKAGERAMTAVEKVTLGLFDKLTWDFLHTGFKLQVGLREMERMQLKYPDMPKEQIAREVSSFVNNSFGGLNWFDVAERSTTKVGKEIAMAALNPKGRSTLQLLLFAPDWTLSTIRAFTTAFEKGSGLKGLISPKMEADLARQYQLRNALMYVTVLEGINLAMSGHDIWDNKDPTRIEFKDGTTMQLAKHSMEPVHWVSDPLKTLSNKLGFIPRAVGIALTGLEYIGPGAKKLVDDSAYGRAKQIVKGAMPFQVQALANAPEGEGIKRAAMGTLGLPVYGTTRQEARKQLRERARAERAKKSQYRRSEAERKSRKSIFDKDEEE